MNIFDEIKQRVNTKQIAEMAGLKLKKCSNRYKALCPFPIHVEKTPSFYIFADGGFYCYGCNTSGGDAVAFYAKLHNLSMIDSAKRIVQEYRLPIEFDGIDESLLEIGIPSHEVVSGLKAWRNNAYKLLCGLYRQTQRDKKELPPDDKNFLVACSVEGILDYWTDKLNYGDESDWLEVYRYFGREWGVA